VDVIDRYAHHGNAHLLSGVDRSATGPACKPQFAPLETGTSSGTSTIDFWRKEEAGDWGGAGWLGWSCDGDQLRAVQLIVRDRANDFAGDAALFETGD
jgi:hypothetical protein